jgi:hypothetical protein
MEVIMAKILTIDGSPIYGLSEQEIDSRLLAARHSGADISYREMSHENNTAMMGFVMGGQFYQWIKADVLPDKFRDFILWDIVGDKLYNPQKITSMLSMRRGKLYMRLDKWMRANIVKKHPEFVIANQE